MPVGGTKPWPGKLEIVVEKRKTTAAMKEWEKNKTEGDSEFWSHGYKSAPVLKETSFSTGNEREQVKEVLFSQTRQSHVIMKEGN